MAVLSPVNGYDNRARQPLPHHGESGQGYRIWYPDHLAATAVHASRKVVQTRMPETPARAYRTICALSEVNPQRYRVKNAFSPLERVIFSSSIRFAGGEAVFHW
ncbi:MAG TPA: hypothetical protein VGE70_07275 [Burkholderiaceae bacterium]